MGFMKARGCGFFLLLDVVVRLYTVIDTCHILQLFIHAFIYSFIHRFRNTVPIECQAQGIQEGSKVTAPALLTSDSLIFMALDLMKPAY